MVAATGLRWILTALFAVLALYGLWRAGRGGAALLADRVAHLLHAVMALAMGAMVWPWGMDLPSLPQVAFFSLAALWVPAAALRWPGGAARGHAVRASLPHAVVTAGMAWMVGATGSATGGGGGAGGGAMPDMPGMDMAGGTATMTLSGAGSRGAAAALALAMLVLALWWLSRGFDLVRADRPGRERDRAAAVAGGHGAYDLVCHGAMALGMAVMCVVVI